jgi:hypothetical protein
MSDGEQRRLLVTGEKTFMVTIPSDAHLTFGPWSPPKTDEKPAYRTDEQRRGTLRVYSSDKKYILAVFSGVTSFRDLSVISYAEQIERVESETIWKDDHKGYVRSTTGKRSHDWVAPELPEPLP